MGPTLSFFQQSAREAAQNNQQKGFQEGYLKAIEDFSEALKNHIEDMPKTSEDNVGEVIETFVDSLRAQIVEETLTAVCEDLIYSSFNPNDYDEFYMVSEFESHFAPLKDKLLNKQRIENPRRPSQTYFMDRGL